MADLSGKKKKNQNIFTLLVFPFLVHTKVHLQTEQLKLLQAAAKSVAIGMGQCISQIYSTALFPLSPCSFLKFFH